MLRGPTPPAPGGPCSGRCSAKPRHAKRTQSHFRTPADAGGTGNAICHDIADTKKRPPRRRCANSAQPVEGMSRQASPESAARVPEEIDAGNQDAATPNRPDKGPFEETEGDVAMKSEKLEVVRGSGNVFRDLGHENADAEHFKPILPAEIIKALDRQHLTVRAAHSRTGTAAADFSRIRNATLGGFTVDRLTSIGNRLGWRVEVKVRLYRAAVGAGHARPYRGRII